jgi:hypothetical protein
MHYVYVIRSVSDHGLYIGCSANLRKDLVSILLANHLLRLIAAPGSLSTTKLT